MHIGASIPMESGCTTFPSYTFTSVEAPLSFSVKFLYEEIGNYMVIIDQIIGHLSEFYL